MKNLFLAILFILAATSFAGCGKEDSPSDALAELQTALNEKNPDKLSERIDLENFFAQTYDDATIELAKNYDEYSKKYPDDPYFQHDAKFLEKYNLDHRELHLKFLSGVQNSYFAKIPEPETPEKNPHAYVANEFEKVRLACDADVKNISVNENRATITLNIRGDNSIRGQFIGEMTFKLGFEKNNSGKWRLIKIENLDELTPTLVDKAEVVWITFFVEK